MPVVLSNANAAAVFGDKAAEQLQQVIHIFVKIIYVQFTKFQVFVRHFIDFAFLRYPENCTYGLKLALKGGKILENKTNKHFRYWKRHNSPCFAQGTSRKLHEARHRFENREWNRLCPQIIQLQFMESATITAEFMKKVNKSTTSKWREHREALSALMQVRICVFEIVEP